MPKSTLAVMILGGLIMATGFVLGVVVYPAENGRPNWPLLAAGFVIGGFLEGLGVLSLASRRRD